MCLQKDVMSVKPDAPTKKFHLLSYSTNNSSSPFLLLISVSNEQEIQQHPYQEINQSLPNQQHQSHHHCHTTNSNHVVTHVVRTTHRSHVEMSPAMSYHILVYLSHLLVDRQVVSQSCCSYPPCFEKMWIVVLCDVYEVFWQPTRLHRP